MRDFSLSEEEKGDILAFLVQNSFINEERFAHSYTRGKFYQKKWGKSKIISNLKSKKIPEKLIQKSLSEIDDADYLNTFKKLASNKWLSLTDKNIFTKKKKLQNYLYQKGYENSLIFDCLENIA